MCFRSSFVTFYVQKQTYQYYLGFLIRNGQWSADCDELKIRENRKCAPHRRQEAKF